MIRRVKGQKGHNAHMSENNNDITMMSSKGIAFFESEMNRKAENKALSDLRKERNKRKHKYPSKEY